MWPLQILPPKSYHMKGSNINGAKCRRLKALKVTIFPAFFPRHPKGRFLLRRIRYSPFVSLFPNSRVNEPVRRLRIRPRDQAIGYQGMRTRGQFWKLNQVQLFRDQNERNPIRLLLFNAIVPVRVTKFAEVETGLKNYQNRNFNP